MFLKRVIDYLFPYVKIWLNSLPNNGPYNTFVKWFELEECLIPILLIIAPLLTISSSFVSFYNGEFLKGFLVLAFFYTLLNIATFILVSFRLKKPLSEKQIDFVKKVALKLNMPLPTNKMVKKDLRPYFEAYFEYDKNNSFL